MAFDLLLGPSLDLVRQISGKLVAKRFMHRSSLGHERWLGEPVDMAEISAVLIFVNEHCTEGSNTTMNALTQGKGRRNVEMGNVQTRQRSGVAGSNKRIGHFLAAFVEFLFPYVLFPALIIRLHNTTHFRMAQSERPAWRDVYGG